jgi:PPK2 family polyphosphate:nucleotide phosphotransferase
MKLKKLVENARKLAKRYRISDDSKFRLRDFDPGDTANLDADDKEKARDVLAQGVQAMSVLQDKLYAQNQWAVLLVFQAMDAAGKDGVIRHVMSGLNPQGCQVYSFKSPSPEELDHDYLWRCTTRVPERGRIGIFNRSYYEETLVVRVHPEFLARQQIPSELITKDLWKQRFEDISNYEQYLSRNGIVVRKFYLNVSRKEQKKRFLERLDQPEKNWKFSASDVAERGHWDKYRDAYEDVIRHTATEDSPWFVVPADNKWFTRLVVASVVIDTLASLDLHYPKLEKTELKRLDDAREILLKNG